MQRCAYYPKNHIRTKIEGCNISHHQKAASNSYIPISQTVNNTDIYSALQLASTISKYKMENILLQEAHSEPNSRILFEYYKDLSGSNIFLSFILQIHDI